MQTIRALFGLFVVAAVLYVAWMLLPPYYANFQLEEAMDDNAREGSVNYLRSEQDVRDRVLKSARELDVPLQPEKLHIDKVNSEVRVWGDYTVHVDLPGYPVDLHFTPMSKSKKRAL